MAGYLIEMFAVSLSLTVLVELAVACFLSRMPVFRSRKNAKWIPLVLLVNVLTNPPAVLICWLGRMYLPSASHFPLQLAVEAVVIAAEAAVYCSFSEKPQWDIKNPVLLSVVANGCSWSMGILFTL